MQVALALLSLLGVMLDWLALRRTRRAQRCAICRGYRKKAPANFAMILLRK